MNCVNSYIIKLKFMAKNVVFFSFSEKDRGVVLTIKGRAVNSQYSNLSFQVQDLLTRWDTKDPSVIQRAITTYINGPSRTIVFVGNDTHDSYWVSEEVKMTLEQGKAVKILMRTKRYKEGITKLMNGGSISFNPNHYSKENLD
jgi:hypothetical protein